MYGDGIPAVYSINDNNKNNNNGFGNDWLALIVLFALFGWGGNGFGFGGNGGIGGNAALGVQNSVDTTTLLRGQYEIGQNVSNQACNTRSDIANATYQTQLGFQNLMSQMSNCCCETQRSIDSVNYNNAKNTCDILTAIHTEGSLTRQEMLKINYENIIANKDNRINELTMANQNLNNSIINTAQTQTITSRINSLGEYLAPRTIPSYPVCNPQENMLFGRTGYPHCGYSVPGFCS